MPLEPSDVVIEVTLDSLLGARQHCQQLPLFSRPMRTSRQAGRQYSRLRGRGVDFDQVRAYQPGDDIRNIDWRVTARSQKVHTKVFNEERERPVFIICEQSNRLCFGSQKYFKTALAAEACALIAWTALSHNDRVGGMVFASGVCHEVRPRRSRQAMLQLFRLLLDANRAVTPGVAEAHDTQSEPLNLALRHSREIIRPGSILYLLCDHAAIDQMQHSLMVPLAAHNDLILLPIHDRLDAGLPDHGRLAFTQGEQSLTVDTRDSELRERYRAQFGQRELAWQKLATRLRCTLNPLETSQSPITQLRSMLSGAQARRAR